MVSCRNQKKAEAAAKEVARAGGSKNTVPFYAADLASLDETKALAQQVQKDHPSLDILVNNAGGTLLAPCPRFLACQPSRLIYKTVCLAPAMHSMRDFALFSA